MKRVKKQTTTADPVCPLQSSIDADVAECLRKLGVKSAVMFGVDRKKLVFDALVQLWQGRTGRAPSAPEIASAAGMPLNPVRDVLAALIKSGRVLHPSPSVWIPRV